MKKRAMIFNATSVGRQWSSGYEIDVAAVNPAFELTVVGECKWSEHKLGSATLRELEDKVSFQNLPVAADCRYALFSKAGFHRNLRNWPMGTRALF